MNSSRTGVAIVLIITELVLASLAYASPPDPTWVGGFWDGGDFDDVVIAVTSAMAIQSLQRIDQTPTRIVLGLLLDAPTPTHAYDGSLRHTSRSPPAPAR